ncbi:IPT/TIG domain-containing protein [Piscinibacter defluvii]|uniref:IPT/TIG domain-containing protein n=1 Tax=Piscinibacter defluvii TaxID=1796922 RepID=UPI0013E39DB8|nr:IPT/TIG domain-containing protein [Piscinibacter defluvii]
MSTSPRKPRAGAREKFEPLPDIRFETSFGPPERLDAELERAVQLLAVPGSPEFGRLFEAARCPPPPYGLADGLLRDAHGVLAGNPYAVRSFVETAEQLAALGGHDDGAAPADLFDKPGDQPHAHRRWAPDDAPAVRPESSLPLLAALASVARSGLYPLDPLYRGVMKLLCMFEDLGRVHRLGLAAGGSPQALQRFRAELDWRFPECGPIPGGPDEGIPLPERRNCLPWLDWHKDCLGDIAPGSPTAPYTISAVSPAVACPGDRLLISGSNFGAGGLVVFRRLGGGELKVAAERWSDTEIEVIVPPTAGGGLWLEIPYGKALVCGVLIERNLPGQVYEGFDGSAPYVEALHLGGSHVGPFVVAPGGTFAVHWRAYGATGRTLVVTDETGVERLRLGPNLPAVGVSPPLQASSPAAPVRWRARLEATGGCSPGIDAREIEIWVRVDPALLATGIEVTQAIQYFRSAEHLTDANDRQADNSMPQVRDKRTWVRVYVQSYAAGMLSHGWTVRGELQVERIVDGNVAASFVLASTVPTISVRADASYTDLRGNIGRTLNFILPAAEAQGRLRLSARCRLDDAPLPGPLPALGTSIDFALQRRLRVAGIMVAFDGPPMDNPPAGTPNLVIAAPALADLDATLGYTLATLPIGAAFDSRNAGTVALNVPLNDQPPIPGGCTPNWGTLMNLVTQARDADGNLAGWLYYGLLPTGVPMGPVIGCGGGVATGSMGDGVTLAHEIGHMLGRPHAPCGNVGASDAAYPAYEPYDMPGTPGARLGEYGLDNRDGSIHPPTEFDFMSYCGPRWVSLHNHALYVNAAGLNPVTLPVGRQEAAGMVAEAGTAVRLDLACIAGRVDEDDHVQVDSVVRAALESPTAGGVATRLQFEALDEKGTKLGFGWVHAVVPAAAGHCAGCGGGAPTSPPQGPYLFEARLAWQAAAVELRLRDGEKVLWSRRRRKTAPAIESLACEIDKAGQLKLAWKARLDPEAQPQAWVQWAPAGKTRPSARSQWTHAWRGLAVGLRGEAAQLDARGLPPGRVFVRLVLHDGFASVAALRELEVPVLPARVSIVHPQPGHRLSARQGLLLGGRARDGSDADLAPDRLVWRLDGKLVGRGPELWLPAGSVKPGAHEAVLAVDGKAGAGMRAVKFTLTDEG